MNHMC